MRNRARGEHALGEILDRRAHAREALLLGEVVLARLSHLRLELLGARLVRRSICRLLVVEGEQQKRPLLLAASALHVVMPLGHRLEPLLELAALVHHQRLLLAEKLLLVLREQLVDVGLYFRRRILPLFLRHLHLLALLCHLFGQLAHLRRLFLVALLLEPFDVPALRLRRQACLLLGLLLALLNRLHASALLLLLHHHPLLLLLPPLDDEASAQNLLVLFLHTRVDRAVQTRPRLGLPSLDVDGMQPLGDRFERRRESGELLAHLVRRRGVRLRAPLIDRAVLVVDPHRE